MCCNGQSVPLHHFNISFGTNLSFAPLLCALCLAAKFGYFYDWLEFSRNLIWALKHGIKWYFATTLVKSGARSVSAALWTKPKRARVASPELAQSSTVKVAV